MIVYESTKNGFMNDVENDSILGRIETEYTKHFGNSGLSQVNSWKNSMDNMYKVLNDITIPADAGIAIEFNIPMTAKRIDFIITGLSENAEKTVIIIELKQWEKCRKIDGRDGIVETYTGHALRQVAHPSYQAWSYQSILESYSQTVQDEHIGLHPCAYLQNYQISSQTDIIDPIYKEYIEKAPLFGRGDVAKLRSFIDRYIKRGDQGAALYDIADGKIRPSKMLQDVLRSMLSGNREFVMIDDQKVVYEQAKALAEESRQDTQKRVLIVKGGPGTGKTVVAVNLLVDLTRKGMLVQYATKNSAPRNVYFHKLKGKRIDLSPKFLFKGTGTYVGAEENQFDVLLADEAHRLNLKSGMMHNYGENQIKEIIAAAKLSVFFIDEEQRVTLQDIGSIDEIEKQAKAQNAEICTMQLSSQFRCNGSDGYLAWLDNLLEIKETANYELDMDFDFRVYDDPNDMRKEIIRKNTKNKSRIVAGYCWNWPKEGQNNKDFCDIDIPAHNFRISWNLKNTDTWAIDRDSINEAGCIHTCQGLEFDYVGVIVGDDLRYENGHVITDYTKRAKTDKSLFGIKKMMAENPEEAEKTADEIIRNTYRTLMTRGMKGCYIFCTVAALNKYIKSRIHGQNNG